MGEIHELNVQDLLSKTLTGSGISDLFADHFYDEHEDGRLVCSHSVIGHCGNVVHLFGLYVIERPFSFRVYHDQILYYAKNLIGCEALFEVVYEKETFIKRINAWAK